LAREQRSRRPTSTPPRGPPIKAAAVPGTARLYVVGHPDSTDPALGTEAVVAYEKVHPDIDTWGLIVLPSQH